MPEFSICCRTVGVLVGLAMLAGCAANAPVSKQAEPEPVRSPEQARELARQGMLAHQQGQTSVAIEALQKAVALDPTDAAAANNLALLLKQQNRFEEAAGVLRTAIQGSPDVADLHYNLAVISEIYLLDLSAALSHYQRYTELAAEEDKAVTGWMADLQRRLQ
ncbi:MAG: tetratricopeptide repeat protein [Marinobacter vinifirmus]